MGTGKIKDLADVALAFTTWKCATSRKISRGGAAQIAIVGAQRSRSLVKTTVYGGSTRSWGTVGENLSSWLAWGTARNVG